MALKATAGKIDRASEAVTHVAQRTELCGDVAWRGAAARSYDEELRELYGHLCQCATALSEAASSLRLHAAAVADSLAADEAAGS